MLHNPQISSHTASGETFQCSHCDHPPFHDKRGIACHVRFKHKGLETPKAQQIDAFALPPEEIIVRVPEPPTEVIPSYDHIESGMLCSRCHVADFVFKRPLPDLCDKCRAFYVSVEQILNWHP